MTSEQLPATPALSNAAEMVLGPWSSRSFLIEGLHALAAGQHVQGPAYTIRLSRAQARDGANVRAVLSAFDGAPKGSVVIVQLLGDVGGAVVGDIIAHRLRAIGVAGLVVEGPIRDLEGIAAHGPATWYRSVCTSGLEMADTAVEVGVELSVGAASIQPGAAVVADGDGVFVSSHGRTAEIFAASGAVDEREKRWHQALENGVSLVDAILG